MNIDYLHYSTKSMASPMNLSLILFARGVFNCLQQLEDLDNIGNINEMIVRNKTFFIIKPLIWDFHTLKYCSDNFLNSDIKLVIIIRSLTKGMDNYKLV